MVAIGQFLESSVALEEFIVELLERGYRVERVSREEIPLPQHETDSILKTAATHLAAKRLRLCLGIDEAEVRHRFGLPILR